MSKAKPSNRGASRANSSKSKSSSKLLLPIGFVAGVGCTLALQWLLDSAMLNTGPSPGMAANEVVEQEEFEFYTLLGNLRVAVPEPDPSTIVEDRAVYWLQAASFRNRDDAENLRVSLLLMNMEAEVRPSTNDNGVWYRVVAGPFESRTLVAKAKDSLVREGIHAITLRQELPRE